MVSKHVRRGLCLFVAVAGATLLAGCGESSGEQAPQSTSKAVTLAPMELIRTEGTVVNGEEPGCLMLDTGVRRYHLVGGAEATLEVGQKVTVTGLADPNTTSTCEQATPLTIDKIEPPG
jgi:hypothetical protein